MVDTSMPYNLQFIDKHVPALEDGDYQISINQNVESTDSKKPIAAAAYSYNATFAIYGPRFSLSDDNVSEVFPPNNSTGEHSHVMPHVMLKRSTLPWERQVKQQQRDLPWVALLVFYEEEEVSTSTLTVADLTQSLSYITKESFQKDTDKLTVIDVEEDLLKKVMPTIAELPYLSHVRAILQNGQSPEEEFAAVIASRLPKKKGKSIAHLVSLENCFGDDGFDYEKTKVNGKIRLVSLTSFQFSCLTKKQSFKGLLENLNTDPDTGERSPICTLRLTQNSDSSVDQYLDMGYVPMYHYLRSGKKTASWYHSPFAPTPEGTLEQLPLPAKSADDLLVFDNNNGMFDTTYAAAWELGRLLGLASTNFSKAMYSWKRAQEQQAKVAEQDANCLIGKSFFKAQDPDNQINVPEVVAAWFKRMQLLSGIPFQYLVPDKTMLPQESIRFFQLDKSWIAALFDGAFSLGRIATRVYDSEQNFRQLLNMDQDITGILIRSEVVSGWPGLQVDALNESRTKIELIAMRHLGKDLLLCLFQGVLNQVEVFKKPESLHFGVDDEDNTVKELRDPDTDSNLDCPSIVVPFKDQDNRVIDITTLVTNILEGQTKANPLTTLSSAGFAYEMIEGAERVIFKTEEEAQ